MKRAYAKLGGQLGLLCVGLGLLVIGLAWNGAAGIDFVSGQMPYLLSGGFLGLALVVIGAVLLNIQNNRLDRAMLEEQLKDLNTRLARLSADDPTVIGGTAGDVVVGTSSYHRPDCRLVAGKGLPMATSQSAVAAGLTPCRVCRPGFSSVGSQSA